MEANSSTRQRDDESAASKTLSSSSTATTGSQRRSRIKPTVVSVARSRPNVATKNKTSADAGKKELDGKSKEEIAPVSQGQLGDKEDPLSRRLTFDGEDADGTSSQEGNQAVTSTRNPAAKLHYTNTCKCSVIFNNYLAEIQILLSCSERTKLLLKQ